MRLRGSSNRRASLVATWLAEANSSPHMVGGIAPS